MRKIVLIIATAMSLGAFTIAMPNNAQARFGAGAIADAAAGASSAEPAQYYRGYRARYSARRAYARRYYSAPRYPNPSSREALDTCAYC